MRKLNAALSSVSTKEPAQASDKGDLAEVEWNHFKRHRRSMQIRVKRSRRDLRIYGGFAL